MWTRLPWFSHRYWDVCTGHPFNPGASLAGALRLGTHMSDGAAVRHWRRLQPFARATIPAIRSMAVRRRSMSGPNEKRMWWRNREGRPIRR